MNVELRTLGVGMEAVGLRAPGLGFYTTAVTFLIAWMKNTISQMAGGEGRAS